MRDGEEVLRDVDDRADEVGRMVGGLRDSLNVGEELLALGRRPAERALVDRHSELV